MLAHIALSRSMNRELMMMYFCGLPAQRFSELSNYMRNLQSLLDIDKLIAELEETQ